MECLSSFLRIKCIKNFKKRGHKSSTTSKKSTRQLRQSPTFLIPTLDSHLVVRGRTTLPGFLSPEHIGCRRLKMLVFLRIRQRRLPESRVGRSPENSSVVEQTQRLAILLGELFSARIQEETKDRNGGRMFL